MPSQPKKICIKFSDKIKTNIKLVNKVSKNINLIKCGSSDIYSKENICTNKEIVRTIKIIVDDNPSK